jgi:zinc D-Ala-D-Ala carboxypeptidase
MALRYFRHNEFDQRGLPGSGEQHMDADFLTLLDELRHRCGFPFHITSGYRSPEYNAQVSSTGENGPHTTGKAADVKVLGAQAHTVLKHAAELGFTGIGVAQKGAHGGRFIHLDTIQSGEGGAPRPWVWSY